MWLCNLLFASFYSTNHFVQRKVSILFACHSHYGIVTPFRHKNFTVSAVIKIASLLLCSSLDHMSFFLALVPFSRFVHVRRTFFSVNSHISSQLRKKLSKYSLSFSQRFLLCSRSWLFSLVDLKMIWVAFIPTQNPDFIVKTYWLTPNKHLGSYQNKAP